MVPKIFMDLSALEFWEQKYKTIVKAMIESY